MSLDGDLADLTDLAAAMAYEQAATGAYYGGVETAAAAYPPPWAVALQDSVAGLRNEIVGLRNDIANVRASLNRVESYTVYVRFNMIFLF